MKKLTVNLPDAVVRETISMDRPQMVALEQAIQMYPWLGELLGCVTLACEREKFMAQAYDLGEPKETLRKRWDMLDQKRCDAYDKNYRALPWPEDD